jgi:hypothetical protein
LAQNLFRLIYSDTESPKNDEIARRIGDRFADVRIGVRELHIPSFDGNPGSTDQVIILMLKSGQVNIEITLTDGRPGIVKLARFHE